MTISLSIYGQKAPIETAKGYQVEIKTSAICEMCQYAIEKELAYEKGVKSANLNLDNKVITVVYNEKKTSPETIRKRISLTGYHADNVQRDLKAYDDLPMCCKDGAHADD
ncbi:MAG: heavy-metal-associated domain-containing protein [Reichenbachiella sp.]